MSVYMVMLPPEADAAAPSGLPSPRAADRVVFVRDGFSAPAFVLSGLWMLWNRLWLPFLGYLVLTLGLELGTLALGTSVPGVAAFCASLLIGLEAGTLRRWQLERRGYRFVAVVEAGSLPEAEIRYFLGSQAPRPVSPRPSAPAGGIVPRIGTQPVVGLTLGQGGIR
ncbi:DUF2628 domain-containing protein [Pannonibacter tanglangensis]|uniref:DUF2628 domain-containing protein n=1 Tax=Pannonibacter tanglangensis TaxID=2750084 RepID=A0ABW9ZLA1_9HYPH|nr:DUF2628 domain-containing protein [Pannonibacter sp. XCT-34]NBN65645.1 DUF2628 domain-containing protein [Pannonibacter sp. XCT-34]